MIKYSIDHPKWEHGIQIYTVEPTNDPRIEHYTSTDERGTIDGTANTWYVASYLELSRYCGATVQEI